MVLPVKSLKTLKEPGEQLNKSSITSHAIWPQPSDVKSVRWFQKCNQMLHLPLDVTPEAWSGVAGHIHPGLEDITQFNAPVVKGDERCDGKCSWTRSSCPSNEQPEVNFHARLSSCSQSSTTTCTNEKMKVKRKRSKGCNHELWWPKDRMKKFNIEWTPDWTNLADCHSKQHAGTCQSEVRPICLHEGQSSPTDLQRCINLLVCAKQGGQACILMTSSLLKCRTSLVDPPLSTASTVGVKIDNRCLLSAILNSHSDNQQTNVKSPCVICAHSTVSAANRVHVRNCEFNHSSAAWEGPNQWDAPAWFCQALESVTINLIFHQCFSCISLWHQAYRSAGIDAFWLSARHHTHSDQPSVLFRAAENCAVQNVERAHSVISWLGWEKFQK